MQPADDLEGGDFKPFFDMAVGILFVLLILIGSLLFFQTAARDQPTADEKQQRTAEWRKELAAFLALLADDLRARGLDAAIDADRTALVLPLDAIAALDRDGFPQILPRQTSDLGQVLAADLACVGNAADRTGRCAPFRLLNLTGATAELRIGAVSAPGLPPERLGSLLDSEFAATLFRSVPDLLRLSGSDSGTLLKTVGTAGTAVPSKPGVIAGDVEIVLNIAAP